MASETVSIDRARQGSHWNDRGLRIAQIGADAILQRIPTLGGLTLPGGYTFPRRGWSNIGRFTPHGAIRLRIFSVATLSDELLAKNAAAGSSIMLLRAEHRREHLDEIEQVLSRR